MADYSVGWCGGVGILMSMMCAATGWAQVAGEPAVGEPNHPSVPASGEQNSDTSQQPRQGTEPGDSDTEDFVDIFADDDDGKDEDETEVSVSLTGGGLLMLENFLGAAVQGGERLTFRSGRSFRNIEIGGKMAWSWFNLDNGFVFVDPNEVVTETPEFSLRQFDYTLGFVLKRGPSRLRPFIGFFAGYYATKLVYAADDYKYTVKSRDFGGHGDVGLRVKIGDDAYLEFGAEFHYILTPEKPNTEYAHFYVGLNSD